MGNRVCNSFLCKGLREFVLELSAPFLGGCLRKKDLCEVDAKCTVQGVCVQPIHIVTNTITWHVNERRRGEGGVQCHSKVPVFSIRIQRK